MTGKRVVTFDLHESSIPRRNVSRDNISRRCSLSVPIYHFTVVEFKGRLRYSTFLCVFGEVHPRILIPGKQFQKIRTLFFLKEPKGHIYLERYFELQKCKRVLKNCHERCDENAEFVDACSETKWCPNKTTCDMEGTSVFVSLPYIMYSKCFIVLIIAGSVLTSGQKSENYNNVIVSYKGSYQASPMATYKKQWPR